MSGLEPLLEIRGLKKEYLRRRGALAQHRSMVQALAGVSLCVGEGETLALVGESGSGKTTLARCVLRVLEPNAGQILLGGEDLTALRGRALRRQRHRFQAVFQDPAGSLDPRQRVRSILDEPLAVHTSLALLDRRRRIEELLESVGLSSQHASRFPHQLSGGERQRVGIARALAPRPELLVADEPVSALDASLRVQVLNLLVSMKDRYGLTLLLISHDLRAVEQIADRVAVLYLGRVVEEAPRDAFFARPLHPYSRTLLASVLSLAPRSGPRNRSANKTLAEVPSEAVLPTGCPYHPRCPRAEDRCFRELPALEPVRDGGAVACFFPGEGSPPPEA